MENVNAELKAYVIRLEGHLAYFEENYRRKQENYQSRCDIDLWTYEADWRRKGIR